MTTNRLSHDVSETAINGNRPNCPTTWKQDFEMAIINANSGEKLCSTGPAFSLLEVERMQEFSLEELGMKLVYRPVGEPPAGYQWDEESNQFMPNSQQ